MPGLEPDIRDLLFSSRAKTWMAAPSPRRRAPQAGQARPWRASRLWPYRHARNPDPAKCAPWVWRSGSDIVARDRYFLGI